MTNSDCIHYLLQGTAMPSSFRFLRTITMSKMIRKRSEKQAKAEGQPFSYLLFQFKVEWGLKAIPAVIGQEVGYTQDGSLTLEADSVPIDPDVMLSTFKDKTKHQGCKARAILAFTSQFYI